MIFPVWLFASKGGKQHVKDTVHAENDRYYFYETEYTREIQYRLNKIFPAYIVEQNSCKDIKVTFVVGKIRQQVIITNEQILFFNIAIIDIYADRMYQEFIHFIDNTKETE